jgi:hypothetical protein
MHNLLIYGLVFFAGAAVAILFYSHEISIARRLIAAVKAGEAAFKREVELVGADLRRVFHL